MTPRAAKRAAERLLREAPPSPQAQVVLRLLATGGVLTARQLAAEADNLSRRSLRTYAQRHWLDPVFLRADRAALLRDRLGEDDLFLYTLGLVGHALVRALGSKMAPSGYLDQRVDRATHDVLCNELVLTLLRAGRAYGYQLRWYGRYEATVHDADGRPLLEPDALVEMRRGEERHLYLIEYHNEDSQRRAREKIDRYQAAYRSDRWQQTWRVQTFPKILCCFTYRAPWLGYLRHLLPEGSSPLRWYAKGIHQVRYDGVQNAFRGWFDFTNDGWGEL